LEQLKVNMKGRMIVMKEEKGIYLGNSKNIRPIFTEHNKDITGNLFVGQLGRGMSFSTKHKLSNDIENERTKIIIDPKNNF